MRDVPSTLALSPRRRALDLPLWGCGAGQGKGAWLSGCPLMPGRRSYGTGHLWTRADAAGRESWYGQWRTPGGGRVKRCIGPKRAEGTREGLTRPQAEAELRRLMAETSAA